MMKSLASLCFLVGCATHAAPPAAPPSTPPPTATACTPTGAVLFEIDTNDLAAGPEKNVIYDNGAWHLDKSGGGTATGCLAAPELASIQHDVTTAPWTTTPRTGIQCHMEHAPTNYIANGKTVYVDRGCSSLVLDDASAKALGEISQLVKTAETR